MPTIELLRLEWATFRRPGRLIALAAAALSVVTLGLLAAAANRPTCDGPCPAVAGDVRGIADRFWFLHRDLGREGSITVRLTSMTGTITYPPPNHDQIVAGLVPWAKVGVIVKDGVRPGSSYAAVMMTGTHGVRFQHGYSGDVAGREGGVTPQSPRWLRLTRSGDTITGAESVDGDRWATVGTAVLTGLPDTVSVGLFAASPGDLTLRRVGLGGVVEEVRFTQAVGVFDHVAVDGGATGAWRSEPVGGEMNVTDWERLHHASGVTEKDDMITVSGSGDIGPLSDEGVVTVTTILIGLAFGLTVVLVVAARHGSRTARERICRRRTAARAVVVGLSGLATGLVAVGVVLPVGFAVLRANGAPLATMPLLTSLRVVVGVASAVALGAVLAFALGVRLRRGRTAIPIVLSLVVLPYIVTAVPLLPDHVSEWLLRLTPAAGFAVQQTLVEYPQVIAHYAPSTGYFPLPWWAGLLVLVAYTATAVRVSLLTGPTSGASTEPTQGRGGN